MQVNLQASIPVYRNYFKQIQRTFSALPYQRAFTNP